MYNGNSYYNIVSDDLCIVTQDTKKKIMHILVITNYWIMCSTIYFHLQSDVTYYRKQPPTHPHDVKIIFPVQYQPHIKEFSLNHIPDTYIKNTNENYFLNTIKWFSKPFYCYSPAPKAQWLRRSYCTREVLGSISGDDTQFVTVVCWRGSLSLVKKTD